jgi:multimeric flavodoxin WrbA
MKPLILGISGSPRNKNTSYMLKTVLDATGLDYEIVFLKDKAIRLCTACGGCYYSHKCMVKDDMQELYKKLPKADVIVFASPTYFANVTSLMKIFFDRCLPFFLSEKLKGKRAVLLTVGNFRKGEVKFLDNFDIEKAMKSSDGRKELSKTIKRCLDIMKFFCVYHMGMKVVGSAFVVDGNPQLKEKELINLGKKIINYYLSKNKIVP